MKATFLDRDLNYLVVMILDLFSSHASRALISM